LTEVEFGTGAWFSCWPRISIAIGVGGQYARCAGGTARDGAFNSVVAL
jgi:hypothetical protein